MLVDPEKGLSISGVKRLQSWLKDPFLKYVGQIRTASGHKQSQNLKTEGSLSIQPPLLRERSGSELRKVMRSGCIDRLD